MSLDALHDITRDLLLVAHGTRLRQVSAALGEACALKEIAEMTRPARPAEHRLATVLSTRWDGRWAAYFAGAGD